MNQDKYKKIASKYHVEDIPAALIPGSRLSNILDRLESGLQISNSNHEFLRRKGVSSLSRYATYLETFIKEAGRERAERYRAAGVDCQEQETERRLKEEALQAKLKQEQEQVTAAAEKERQEEAKRQRREKERAKKIVVQNTQRQLSETAEDRIARKYGISLSMLKANFPHLVEDDLKLEEEARKVRRQAEEERRIFQIKLIEEANKEKERAEAERLALENDPVNIARKAQDKLMEKYGIYCWRTTVTVHFDKLIDMLQRLDSGYRLLEVDIAWLSTTGYYSKPLKRRYHKNEAAFYAEEFKKKKDYWLAVNASSHYRKCEEADTSDALLNTINISAIKDAKLKSALCTTHGGVKRDLRKFDAALSLGEQAHLLTPKDFRPCTLLGAVNMEIGNYDLGRSWYDKAIERGYSEEAMDDELRSIFMRAEKINQDEMREYLLKTDPIRYSWAEKKQLINKKTRAAARITIFSKKDEKRC
ncbi:MAG: hypothetical protein CDV28_10610 [Candidatus Electronema aureum]|uniref:Tetratricopeptide repeat-containing protein n=1 Tax=Candidatus Electronema aureum TaxID=2005002 RepID=A0A521G358_9BACT|nr:MAG: hypothetical protein CDV28_10610 [Candidatus Electronema aureum]